MKWKTFTARAFAAAALLLALWHPALASQGSGCMPTTGTVSGLTLVQDINAGLAAIISSNSGATAPATDCTAVAVLGQLWLDTSASPRLLKIYDSANWLTIGAVDASGHLWKPPLGGGVETLASATTTDLCSIAGSYVSITGTTTISGFSNTCVAGTMKVLSFVSTPQVTYNATSLILPGAVSITAQAGDSALVVYLGSGNWEAVAWTRADGTSIAFSSVFTGAIFYDAPIAATVSGNTNDWAPTGLSTANVIRLNCSSTSNLTGLTAPATDGKLLVIDSNTTSTSVCTLKNQDASSTAANRFALPRPVAIRPGISVVIKYDSGISRWRLAQEITAQPIAGGFKNLIVTNVATVNVTAPVTPNNQVKITADQITVEDASGLAARLVTVSVTPDITSSGANGLDTSTVATSTGYYNYVIYNPATNVAAGLWSIASTCGTVTLPSGYTYCARTGWNHTDSSSRLQRMTQYGRVNEYKVIGSAPATLLPLLKSGTGGTWSYTANPLASWSSVSLAGIVPSTAARVSVLLDPAYNSASATSDMVVAPNVNFGGVQSTNPAPCSTNTGSNTSVVVPCTMSLEALTLQYAGDGAGSSMLLLSYEDNL